jgi:hypothetical protein
MEKKTWIDLTDMLTWRGHFTGIQRVVYEIAREYSDEANFFYYDDYTNRFFRSNFEQLIEKHQYTGSERQFVSKKTRLLNLTRKYIPNKVIARLPETTKRRIKKVGSIGIESTAATKRAVIAGVKKTLPKSSMSQEEVFFTKEDTVLILGAGWHKHGLMDKLLREKTANKFELVHLAYDLIPVYFPHFFGPGLYEHYTKYLFEAISLSDQLVAISESTKRDVKKFCEQTGLKMPKTSVIRLGEDFEKKMNVNHEKPLVKGDFILCVGTVEVRKNHNLLYQAYRMKLDTGEKMPKLVIVGRPGWLVNNLLYELKNDPVVQDHIVILSAVSDAQLQDLYTNCLFTVYPSFYEGWGLPIAESLAYGKVCLSSNSSSMVEIAGDSIDYFSPYDTVGAANIIQDYFLHPGKLSEKEKQIKQQYKPTSWKQTTTEFRKKTGV